MRSGGGGGGWGGGRSPVGGRHKFRHHLCRCFVVFGKLKIKGERESNVDCWKKLPRRSAEAVTCMWILGSKTGAERVLMSNGGERRMRGGEEDEARDENAAKERKGIAAWINLSPPIAAPSERPRCENSCVQQILEPKSC
jgi:hypothetical protein